MQRLLRTGAAGLLLSFAVAAPAPAASVTVRVEGATQTLVQEVRVTPTADLVVDKRPTGGTTCKGSSGGGALELATDGEWGGTAFDLGGGQSSQAVEVIKSESHTFGSGAYWSLFVNNSPSAVGICEYRPEQGDEVLLFVACEGAPAPTCASQDPLDLRGPAAVKPGARFDVRADEYTSPFDAPATKAPSAGATVTTPDGRTVKTGADGTAALTLLGRGRKVLRVTKEGRVRDELIVCVTLTGTGCAAVDREAPTVRIRGIEDGERFAIGRGPRRLAARVTDDRSGLRRVRLSLVRRAGGACSAFSARRERFARVRCGRSPHFTVGDRPNVSYLLPERLRAGRYVLDVVGIDKAGNRGRSRIAFAVR